MKEKFIRFMQGRYGIDQFSKFLLAVGLVIVLVSALLGNRPIALILYLIGWAFVIYCYFRVFSRNVSKRYSENQAFLTKTYGIRNFFRKQKNIWQREKSLSYLYLPVMQTEDPHTEGQGKD